MVSSFPGVWLYENHGTPDDYDTCAHTLCLLDCISVLLSRSQPWDPARSSEFSYYQSPLCVHHCIISYLRMAERCTIKSTYIHFIELRLAQT
jgi:hypothetical protein